MTTINFELSCNETTEFRAQEIHQKFPTRGCWSKSFQFSNLWLDSSTVSSSTRGLSSSSESDILSKWSYQFLKTDITISRLHSSNSRKPLKSRLRSHFQTRLQWYTCFRYRAHIPLHCNSTARLRRDNELKGKWKRLETAFSLPRSSTSSSPRFSIKTELKLRVFREKRRAREEKLRQMRWNSKLSRGIFLKSM